MYRIGNLLLALLISMVSANNVFSAQRYVGGDGTGITPIILPASTTPEAYYSRYIPSPGTSPSNDELIVFIPGFDLAVTNTTTLLPGTIASADSLSRKIKVGRPDGNGGFLPVPSATGLYNESEHLVHYLADQLGYTVVVVDFLEKNRDIVQNAAVLEYFLSDPDGPVIESSIRGKNSTVLGFSMGGMIARYALTQMEFNNRYNPISLFVSLDAPHKGAYLPHSLEIFARTAATWIPNSNSYLGWFDNELGELTAEITSRYNSVAARQMLGVWIGEQLEDGSTQRVGNRFSAIEASYLNAPDPHYHALRQSLANMGQYPKNSRNIAISNGNMSGVTTLYNPDGSGSSTRNGNYLVGVDLMEDSIFRRRDRRLLEANLHDDPVTSRSNCYVYIRSFKENCPRMAMPQQLRNMSSTPGSTIDAIAQLGEQFAQVDLSYTFVEIYGVEDRPSGEGLTTFIPTLSAFDIPVNDWFTPAATLSDVSPFDAVYANQTINTPHSLVSEETLAQLGIEISTTDAHRREQLAAAVISAVVH